jgi:hypothetical protein
VYAFFSILLWSKTRELAKSAIKQAAAAQGQVDAMRSDQRSVGKHQQYQIAKESSRSE